MQLIVIGFLVAAVTVVGARYLRTNSSRSRMAISSTVGKVGAVCKSSDHVFSKAPTKSITLVEGLGVQGDCHLGKTVQHRSRLHLRPPPPNLRQVHLIHAELFDEFASTGADGGDSYDIKPGDLGENITTHGIDLLRLGTDTKLHFLAPGHSSLRDAHPVVRITGLRNPCPQIQKFRNGLQERCLVRDSDRNIVERKAGVMSVVESGGTVGEGAMIFVEQPRTYVPLVQV